ncbi:hypothetical protein EVAR_75075_1 [Eumeta japonica]|uniref:Uncharacterized protein n=1 Tax=Eumeta variegata TaxID=151549 RepID=A0A4C1W006_EUMVA|nr:hypothetical protein EVAR_75075_1 [Eumeta japonica]
MKLNEVRARRLHRHFPLPRMRTSRRPQRRTCEPKHCLDGRKQFLRVCLAVSSERQQAYLFCIQRARNSSSTFEIFYPDPTPLCIPEKKEFMIFAAERLILNFLEDGLFQIIGTDEDTRKQNKFCKRAADAPWYVKNSVLHRDLQLPTISKFMKDASERFFDIASSHPNPLLVSAVPYEPPPLHDFYKRPRNIFSPGTKYE